MGLEHKRDHKQIQNMSLLHLISTIHPLTSSKEEELNGDLEARREKKLDQITEIQVPEITKLIL